MREGQQGKGKMAAVPGCVFGGARCGFFNEKRNSL